MKNCFVKEKGKKESIEGAPPREKGNGITAGEVGGVVLCRKLFPVLPDLNGGANLLSFYPVSYKTALLRKRICTAPEVSVAKDDPSSTGDEKTGKLVEVQFVPDQLNGSRLRQTLQHELWTVPNTRTKVTDRAMVELTNRLHGWTRSVYTFGCAFIHVSTFADYQTTNPFDALPIDEQAAIRRNNMRNRRPNQTRFLPTSATRPTPRNREAGSTG